MQAADVAKQIAHRDLCLRYELFSIGLKQYVGTLTESQALGQLRVLDPTNFSDPTTLRYTKLETLQRELCSWLYRKEPGV